MALMMPVEETALTLVSPTHAPHPVDVYVNSLAEGSRRTISESLTIIARIVAGNREATAKDVLWEEQSYNTAMTIRAALSERYAYSTVNKMLSAYRGLLKTYWRGGQMAGEQYHTAVSIPNVTGSTVPAGREITAGELVALMAHCARDHTVLGRRDAALIALLYACGARRAEVASLTLENYDPEKRAFMVTGKRNKQRMLYVPETGAAQALDDWLAIRGAHAGPVFVRVHKSGKLGTTALSTQGVYDALCARAAKAGVAALSPHDFRRTFVGDLLDRGADIVTVQRMAGHANVQTTARYDRRPEEAKRKAAALLHVPYRREQD